jgi:YidC/Oxa1 family membrane protein insertase
MDKKSIIFVLLLTASFFLINNFLFPPTEQPPAPIQTTVMSSEAHKPSSIPSNKNETLYVIENTYQQLVFSNLGGSLAEVNLVLENKEHPDSPIKPIRADRVLKKYYPQDDMFPLKSYQIAETSTLEPKLGGYYPLLRRGVSPELYGLAITSDQGGSSHSFYLKRLEKDLIQFEGTVNHCRITKTFSFPKNTQDAPYCFDVTLTLDGDTEGLWLGTGIPEVEIISNSSNPSLKYRATKNKKAAVEQISLPKASPSFENVNPDWICNSNGFLGVILDPLTDTGSGISASQVPGNLAPTRLGVIDTQYDLYPLEKYPGYSMKLPLSKASQTMTFRVYAGPFASDILKQVDQTYSNKETRYNPNYVACISFHGWFSFISEPFAKFLFFLMEIFHFVTRSWGFSIILLTAALRLMLYPLNAWSIKSTSKMQKMAPKVAQIQEKYKKDPKRAQMETMSLYKQHGVNPLGGCFPLLIQMPFLIGMFDLLKSTFELRGVSFIPGWIDNLTAPDIVFSWSYPIWFFGTSFHLLPILLGVIMYFQQQMTATLPKDPKQWTDQQRQQRFMGNMMVLVFSVLFYHFPSGLNIYWLFSMLFGMLQQWWTTRKLKAA